MIYIILAVLFIILIIWVLRKSHICAGGQITQGCGKVIFPWQFKVDINGNYCCQKCFMRDYKLYSEAPNRMAPVYNWTESEYQEYAKSDLRKENFNGECSIRSSH